MEVLFNLSLVMQSVMESATQNRTSPEEGATALNAVIRLFRSFLILSNFELNLVLTS